MKLVNVYNPWTRAVAPSQADLEKGISWNDDKTAWRTLIMQGYFHQFNTYTGGDGGCYALIELQDGTLIEHPIERIQFIGSSKESDSAHIPSDADIIADTIHNSMVTVVGMFQNFMAFQLLLALNQLRAVNMDESLIRQARDLIDRLTTIMSGMDDDEDDEPDILRDLGLKD